MKFLTHIRIMLLCLHIVMIQSHEHSNTIVFDTPDSSCDKLSIGLENSLTYLTKKWQLHGLAPISYPSVFNNYIAHAYSELYQQDIIIKIGQSNDECKALEYFQGNGMVELLDYDLEHFALLLQYIPSNITLADYLCITQDDNLAISAFVDVFKRIHASPKHLTVAHYAKLEDELFLLHSYNFTKIPAHLLQKACNLYGQLFRSDTPEYLLHGDLHCRNILQNDNEFIAIDPWASVGPLTYEAASFLTSPTDFLLLHDTIQDILQNRLNRLSDELQLDKQQLRDFSFIRLIYLACICETKNRNDDWIEQFIQVAQVVNRLNI